MNNTRHVFFTFLLEWKDFLFRFKSLVKVAWYICDVLQEVRKANKLLGRIEEAAKRLSSNQTTAEMMVEVQVGHLNQI